MSRLDAISSRMSKLMLKRWTMLGEMCSKDECSTPLMRDPETNNVKCVWHDVEELFPEEAVVGEDPKDPVPVGDSKTVIKHEEWSNSLLEDEKLDDQQNEIRRRKREQGDIASERIGKRLLQGWAMIDRSCPSKTCYNIPLVQDKEKVQECVICNQKYMDESDYIAKYGNVKDQDKPAEKQPETDVFKQPKPSSPPAAAAQPVTSGIPITGINTAIDVLDTQITQLSARLATASDLEDIQRIAKAIGTCAEAITKCKACVNYS
ncbi:hypothetical protein IWW36_003598 [Coemansia brasiliensis]|uniref:Uncharacterized protein n=1 Tax=Coemansia brasiliensis TaxID=2650707 RepID=A0A9W8LYE7_9FUNG|nr:hypothetical protein IWW36_003598 [Coemansia brasiliensis]